MFCRGEGNTEWMTERRLFPDSPVIFEIIDKENADSRTVKAGRASMASLAS